MTFSARFELGSQPEIFGGWTRDIGFKGKTWERKIKCHEFTVKSVSFRIHPDKFYCEGSVKLVRGKYAEGKIYGPASSRSDKSLIYPCAHFKCSNAIHAVKIPLCARTQIMRYPLVEAVVSPLLSGIFLLIWNQSKKIHNLDFSVTSAKKPSHLKVIFDDMRKSNISKKSTHVSCVENNF